MCFLDITLIVSSPHCPSSFISLETLTAGRKGVLEEKVFLEISQIHRKTPVQESLF